VAVPVFKAVAQQMIEAITNRKIVHEAKQLSILTSEYEYT
jgi:hypothetical protein